MAFADEDSANAGRSSGDEELGALDSISTVTLDEIRAQEPLEVEIDYAAKGAAAREDLGSGTYDDVELCNTAHPYIDEHGPFCSQCTKAECLKYEEGEDCSVGSLYNNRLLGCSTCAVEFGSGTIRCN